MDLIVARMKWIMLVSGALTCTMLYAAIAPQAALRSMFGDAMEGPLAEIIVRNWGALSASSAPCSSVAPTDRRRARWC